MNGCTSRPQQVATAPPPLVAVTAGALGREVRHCGMRDRPIAGLSWGQRLLQAFALGLVSCGSNPLKTIEIGVRTEWVGSPAQRVVQVEFWKPGKCFVIPNGTRVLLNGKELHLSMAGGHGPLPSRWHRPSEVQSLDWPMANCLPAYFSSEPFTPTAPRADRVDVEMFGKTGFVEIEGLLAQRSLRVTSGPVETGKLVTLEWSPASDGWPDPMIGSEVDLDRSGLPQIEISGSDLFARAGKFRFRLPAVGTGLVQLSVNPGATRPTARVKACHGFSHCTSREVLGAPPIEVQCGGAGAE